MDLCGKSLVVVGGTGEIGRVLVRALAERGARPRVIGRNTVQLEQVARFAERTARLDLRDSFAARRALAEVTDDAGCDGLLLCAGRVAFAETGKLPAPLVRELFEVNLLGAISVIEAALPLIRTPGVVAALTGAVVRTRPARMAHYVAAKAGLSAYLDVLRREHRRRGLLVVDAQPPHVETGFACRAIYGSPPALPAGISASEVAERLLDAISEDQPVVQWPLPATMRAGRLAS
ncbi:SDR family NAD(P)-dependent oxidoreductase [Thermoleophilum album]|uniref:Short-chain dehydrogenase n=1 Tax=Thermoleophilum album TaxID=29539 RepID=A0A1H6FYT2_THEAL|nr:SDR family NAD(P)-dependent oxidoreductase [Thermoleophilum album]SEH14875.1 Short-chain dehydrogenase [Thermoleophilum album]